jgi:hypothetical protein
LFSRTRAEEEEDDDDDEGAEAVTRNTLAFSRVLTSVSSKSTEAFLMTYT